MKTDGTSGNMRDQSAHNVCDQSTRNVSDQSTCNVSDLHSHTTYSDGTLTPRELVALARRCGLTTLAITDHDTLGGIPEALAAAQGITDAHALAAQGIPTARGLTLIPGVELGADFRRELHILGYFRADALDGMTDFLARTVLERETRNRLVIEKLNAIGIPLKSRDVELIAGKRVYGRPHIAAALIKIGASSSIEAAFHDYLASGRKAYVRKQSPSPADCVRAITAAGGVPVIAHPVQIGIKLKELAELIKDLIPFGLGGVEAYYPDNTPSDTQNFVTLTESLGLLATGGSDFHGDYRKKVRLGSGKNGNLFIPDGLPERLLRAIDRRASPY